MNNNIDWMNEKMECLPGDKVFYKIICFFTFRRKRKFTYKEWYIIMSILNGQTKEGNLKALENIRLAYRKNNIKIM